MQEQRALLTEGIAKFGDAPKLHMMLAQLEEAAGAADAARRALQAGLKASPKSVPLWVMLARLEERQGNVPTARAILEQVCPPLPPRLASAAGPRMAGCAGAVGLRSTLPGSASEDQKCIPSSL